MNCPSCNSFLSEGVDECPACGFSATVAKMRFGGSPRFGIHVTDTTHETLTKRELARIKKDAAVFEKKFPQGRFSVFVTRLAPGQSTQEFAFHIANQCQFTGIKDKLGRNFGLLLVVNLTAGDCCLNAGYGFELLLDQDALERILSAGQNCFAEEQWSDGAIRCMRKAAQILERAAAR